MRRVDPAHPQRNFKLPSESVFPCDTKHGDASAAEGCEIIGYRSSSPGSALGGNDTDARNSSLARGFGLRGVVAAPTVKTDVADDERA